MQLQLSSLFCNKCKKSVQDIGLHVAPVSSLAVIVGLYSVAYCKWYHLCVHDFNLLSDKERIIRFGFCSTSKLATNSLEGFL